MDTNRTVVVVSTHISVFERVVSDAGFTVVGAADTTLNGERLAAHFQPDIVVLDNDLPGEQDFAMLDRMRAVVPTARLVLVVSQHWSPSETSSLGAAAVIGRDDLPMLASALHDLEGTIDLTSATGQVERRSGRDRRVHQDWTKVGWERRAAIRRAADRADAPVG